jgi:hypothetical protein
MSEWTKVMTHPFGLAAFALFLVFLLVSRTTKATHKPWLNRMFVLMAFIALLGGIGLAYQRTSTPALPSGEIAQPSQSPTSQGPTDPRPASEARQNLPPSIQQSTRGPNSPAIADVKGDVTIIIKEPNK